MLTVSSTKSYMLSDIKNDIMSEMRDDEGSGYSTSYIPRLIRTRYFKVKVKSK